jgi:hypothetical protein
LNAVVSKVIADPSFKLTDKFNKAIDSFSRDAGRNEDVKSTLDMLPKLKFSANDSRMLIAFKLPPEILRTVLLKSGFLQEEPQDEDAGDDDSDSM